MMKRIPLLLLAAALFFPSFALSTYERAISVTATDVVDNMNSFLLIENNDEIWLIHHKTGCGSVKEGDPLTLVIRGELDGNRDLMWKGDQTNCIVDMAELITGRLRVTTVSPADNYTSVSDNGKPYRIYYSERCKAMRGMNGYDVYVKKYGGSQLRAGDQFFLPGAGEMCSITYVMPEGVTPPDPTPPTEDIKRPTTPTHFRAIPSNGAVYLYWYPSRDDSGISHYVISASLYHRDDPVARDPSVKPQEMQDTFVTPTNQSNYKLEGLDSDELYFFRIIAVDNAGNESSYWSEEATATTKSSISSIGLENNELRLFQAQETNDFFLLRWNSLPGTKYTVILEIDNERVFIDNDWRQTYIRILKKPERKGKQLELIVKSLNFRGLSQSSVAKFSF